MNAGYATTQVPMKSFTFFLANNNRCALSCMRIAKRACIGPMSKNAATAATKPQCTPP